MTRALAALVAVAAVAAVVVLGLRALTGDDPSSTGAGPAAPHRWATVPAAPLEAPAEGLYVVSTVTADGQVEVQTWLRVPQPVTELRLTTTDPDLLPGSTESLGLVVRTMDGRLLAHRTSVGTNPQRIRLRDPATDLYLSYTIDGAMDDRSPTVQGRSLARVLGMDIDYAGADGSRVVVRRLVTSPGTVLNVACLAPSQDFDAAPRPCGSPTGDGDWLVELRGEHRQDRLLAQLEG